MGADAHDEASMRCLLNIIGTVEGHNHAVDERCNRLGYQRLMAFRGNRNVLTNHFSQLWRMDVGTVDDGSGFKGSVCCLNSVDASGFRLKPGDLGVGQKFNTHPFGTLCVGLCTLERICVTILLAEGSAKHTVGIQVWNNLFCFF